MVAQRGEDLRFDLTLDFRKAVFGGEEIIRIRHLGRCHVCKGSGRQRSIGSWLGMQPSICNSCEGRGRTTIAKNLTITIPAGVDQGTRLRVSQEGDVGENGGEAGDLYVYLFVNPHPEFRREGIHLSSEVTISAQQALSGCEIQINTIDGVMTLTIPPQTQTNTVLTLQNRGVPTLGNPGQRGNHSVTVRIDQSSNSVNAEETRIKLDEVGNIFLNEQPVSLEELSQHLFTLQEGKNCVLFHRPGMLEPGLPSTLSEERLEAVFQAILVALEHTKVPIRLCSRPDFSDSIGPDERSYLPSEVPSETANDLLNQGVEKFKQGDYQGAIANLKQAIALDPNFALAYSAWGNVCIAMQDYQSAIACFGHAIQLAPDLVEAYGSRGLAYHLLGDRQRALEELTYSIQLDPSLANSYYTRGQINVDLDRIPQALADFEQAIDLYLSTETRYIADDALPRIQNHYRSGIAFKHSPVKPLIQQAAEAQNTGNFQQALTYLTEAIQSQPELADLYYYRSAAYQGLGQKQDALADLSQAIQLNPRIADYYYNRGGMYFDMRNDACIADFNQVIKLDPYLAEAHFNLGSFYVNQGRKQDGLPYIQRAAELFQQRGDRWSYEQVIQAIHQVSNMT